MSLYSFVVSLHVIVAVLGVGTLPALALLTRRPPLPAGAPRPLPPEPALRVFGRLLRLAQVSLALMLVTGATLVALVHGAFGRQRWMIASVIFFVLVGAATGIAQAQLRKALAPAGSVAHVERAHRLIVAACAGVALIAWLMESKPF